MCQFFRNLCEKYRHRWNESIQSSQSDILNISLKQAISYLPFISVHVSTLYNEYLEIVNEEYTDKWEIRNDLFKATV